LHLREAAGWRRAAVLAEVARKLQIRNSKAADWRRVAVQNINVAAS